MMAYTMLAFILLYVNGALGDYMSSMPHSFDSPDCRGEGPLVYVNEQFPAACYIFSSLFPPCLHQ